MNRRTRVLVITPDFPPSHGGIQLLMHRLVNHWHGVEATVLTRRAAQSTGRRGSLPLLNARAVAAALRSRPDLVLSGHIAVAPAAWAIRRALGVPYVQYVYGMEVSARRELARFATRHATAVVAISEYTASLVRSWVNPTALFQIAPGVDAPVIRRAARSAQPLLVTVSRLTERYKGHDVVLRALPLVRARIPDVQWVVVGEGPLRPIYEGMVETLGLRDQVRFVGALTDAERDLWLDRAHVFVMPSRLTATGGGEGFGIAYLEAGAHGLPVVAGNVGGACDAMVNGDTGVLVNPTDHVALADAVCELLLDRRRADALGRAGESRAREFAWPNQAIRVEHLLQEAAAARAA